MSDPRFETAEQSEVYAELMRHEPAGLQGGSPLQLGFLAVLTVATGAMTVPFLSTGVTVVLPALMALISGGLFLNLLVVMIRLNFGPLVRVVVLVREKKADWGDSGARNGRLTMRVRLTSPYSVTLEMRSGERATYPVAPSVARRFKPDELGVAYLKAGVLLDFKRL